MVIMWYWCWWYRISLGESSPTRCQGGEHCFGNSTGYSSPRRGFSSYATLGRWVDLCSHCNLVSLHLVYRYVPCPVEKARVRQRWFILSLQSQSLAFWLHHHSPCHELLRPYDCRRCTPHMPGVDKEGKEVLPGSVSPCWAAFPKFA